MRNRYREAVRTLLLRRIAGGQPGSAGDFRAGVCNACFLRAPSWPGTLYPSIIQLSGFIQAASAGAHSPGGSNETSPDVAHPQHARPRRAKSRLIGSIRAKPRGLHSGRSRPRRDAGVPIVPVLYGTSGRRDLADPAGWPASPDHAGRHRRCDPDTDPVVPVRFLYRQVYAQGRARRTGSPGTGPGGGLALRCSRAARLSRMRAE
jgi:hypothetical protein